MDGWREGGKEGGRYEWMEGGREGNFCKVKSVDDNCREWVECMSVASGIYGCG